MNELNQLPLYIDNEKRQTNVFKPKREKKKDSYSIALKHQTPNSSHK